MMQYIAQITTKGRVTIPLALRRKLKLKLGNKLEWSVESKIVKFIVVR